MKNKVNEILDDLGVDPISEMEEFTVFLENSNLRRWDELKKQVDKNYDLDDT